MTTTDRPEITSRDRAEGARLESLGGTSYPSIGAATGAAMAHNAERAAAREDDRTRRSLLYRDHGLCGEPFGYTGACSEPAGHKPFLPHAPHAEDVGMEAELAAVALADAEDQPEPAGRQRKTRRSLCPECRGLRMLDVNGLFRFHDGASGPSGRPVPCPGSRKKPEDVAEEVRRRSGRRAPGTGPDPSARLAIVAEHLDAVRTGRAPAAKPTNEPLLASPVLAQRARDLLKALGL